MRGRTFSNAFIILDEAQNTTVSQMRLFLTRFGENVRVVITGDTTQSDIKEENGLQWALDKLRLCPSVEIVEYKQKHVVRSALVADIIQYIDD
jgi:phosphate starvation-inducible PhoH-like protein